MDSPSNIAAGSEAAAAICAVSLAGDSLFLKDSRALAESLGLPTCTQDCSQYPYHLSYGFDEDNAYPVLTLTHREAKGSGKKPHWEESHLSIDFVGGRAGHRRQFGGGKGQPLTRAVGLKGDAPLSVVDATAGLGRDAFVLACLGAQVTLLERSSVIAALLQDGLTRAAKDAEVGPIVAAQMQLIQTDAIHWLQTCATRDERPAVVYLDPMYPHRTKSALVKKEMRFLRDFAGDNPDAPELLAAARSCATQRVVVKRPIHAEPLAGPRPVGEVKSKNTRYDIYSPA